MRIKQIYWNYKRFRSINVKLDIKNRSSGFTLAVPSKKMNELIGDNLLLIGIILIALVILIIVVLLLYKKNKIIHNNS